MMKIWQSCARKVWCVWLPVLLYTSAAKGQADSALPPVRCGNAQLAPVVLLGTGYVAGLTALGFIWYKDNLSWQFRFFNDNHEWLGVDKAGHAITSYYEGAVVYSLIEPLSSDKKKTALLAGTAGFWLQLPIEILDGFSSGYGFSYGDVLANASGAALFAGQQYAWGRQVILPKFSYHYTSYAQYSPNLLGSNWYERVIKDYNGHTYWLSLPCSTFMRHAPPWLCVSAGYSGEGMLRGTLADQIEDQSLPQAFRQPESRFPQLFLSLDVDLKAIPTQNRALRQTFRLLNFVKLPAPALMYLPTKGKFQGKALYF